MNFDLDAEDISLHGRNAKERYDDDDLVVIGDMPKLAKASLLRQHITKLPPFPPTLKWLWLGELYSLKSLAGIEKLVGLQTLWLGDFQELDLEDAFERLAELPDLTELQISTKGKLPPGIEKLPSVLSLHLACNDYADAFLKLGKLSTLRKLAVSGPIPNALAPLSQLTSLTIAKGSSEPVPSSIGALVNLERLNLEGCFYTALPPEIGRLSRLEMLSVAKTAIAELPDELWTCAALKVLDLENDLIKELPDGVTRLTKLETLKANGKKLKKLPDKLGDLQNLRELWIPWKLKKVPESLFELKLRRFVGPHELSQKITLLEPETPQSDRVRLYDADRLPADFGDPKDLELEIHEHTAPIPQLSQLRRLEELVIDTGNLDDAFRRLVSASKLKELKITGEHERLPDSLGDLTQISKLDIGDRDGGALVELTPAIAKLDLQSLAIGKNKLAHLPDAIGELANLERFEMRAYSLVELTPAIGKLRKLTTLDLDELQLARLPTELAQCTALATLVLGGAWGGDKCPIKNLEIVGELPALRTLSFPRMHGLPLAKILKSLEGGPLEALDLRYTGIEKLPKEIGGLAKLRSLELDSTRVEKLPDEIKRCTELRYISIPYSLDSKTFKDQLPKGRWKHNFRSHVTWYTRSD